MRGEFQMEEVKSFMEQSNLTGDGSRSPNDIRISSTQFYEFETKSLQTTVASASSPSTVVPPIPLLSENRILCFLAKSRIQKQNN